MFLDELSPTTTSSLSQAIDPLKIKQILSFALWQWYWYNPQRTVSLKWKFLNLGFKVRDLKPLIELIAGPDPVGPDPYTR